MAPRLDDSVKKTTGFIGPPPEPSRWPSPQPPMISSAVTAKVTIALFGVRRVGWT